MKNTIQFEPLEDTIPPYWHEDFFKLALERIDTSQMSALDIALYECSLLRARTVAEFNDKKIKKAVAKALNKVAKKFDEKKAIENLLRRGKLTIEEIAEDINVSIKFVKEVQDSLNIS